MGRGYDSSSETQSRLQRTITKEGLNESASDEVEATDERASAETQQDGMTDNQRDMAAQLADELGRELPSSRFEPETVDGSESDNSVDPFEQRLQDQLNDPLRESSEESRPTLTGPTAPESTYELIDPSSTRSGLDTFGDLTRPGSILGSSNDNDDSPFTVPSLFQGKTESGGPGYKAVFDDADGVQSPKTNGSFAENYPRLNSFLGLFTGTKDAAGATTPKGEALNAAEKDIVDSSTPAPKPTAPAKPAVPEQESPLEKAIREAAEEAAAAAAAEAAAAEAAKAEAAKEAGAREAVKSEKKSDDEDAKTTPDDYVDPEKVIAFNAYIREQSGYKGPVRDGDIDWDDQPKDSTGGRIVDQSDLYGDRTDQAKGQADLPDEVVVGNDHDINWGPDAGNPGSGLKEDVPADVGRAPDLSHLNPENQSPDGPRIADRDLRQADGTPTPLSEGARRAAESSTDQLAAALSSDEETTSTVRSTSAGGETQTVDLSGEPESNDEDDENVPAAEEPTANDESNTITVSEFPDDGSVVYTPSDGQPTDTVTFGGSEDEAAEPDGAEDDAAPTSSRVITPVEGRVTVSDLKLQTERTFFDEPPAETVADPATDAPAAEEGAQRVSLPFEEIKWDLRVPSPLDEVTPMLTLERIGGDDDSDANLSDDE